jgi:hypothetical protein
VRAAACPSGRPTRACRISAGRCRRRYGRDVGRKGRAFQRERRRARAAEPTYGPLADGRRRHHTIAAERRPRGSSHGACITEPASRRATFYCGCRAGWPRRTKSLHSDSGGTNCGDEVPAQPYPMAFDPSQVRSSLRPVNLHVVHDSNRRTNPGASVGFGRAVSAEFPSRRPTSRPGGKCAPTVGRSP